MSENHAMMMVEARQTERVRSFLRARIIFNNNSSTIDCTVKNISAAGAKLEVSNTLSIPDAFDLEVPQKGRTYRARMSWRDEKAIGVEFIDGEAAPAENIHSKMDRLERENAKLRLSIAKLTRQLHDLGHEAVA